MRKKEFFYWFIAIVFGFSILIIARRAHERIFNAPHHPQATFSMIDRNGDGLISREEYDEYQSYFNGRTFNSLDLYNTGYLTLPELHSAGIQFAQTPSVKAVKPTAKKPYTKTPRAKAPQVKKQQISPSPASRIPPLD